MAMLPILLVVSLVAPHAWEGQSTPVTASPSGKVEQATPVVEKAKPVGEQAKPSVKDQKVEAARRAVEVQAARKTAERVPLKVVVPKQSRELTVKVARLPVEKRAPRDQAREQIKAENYALQARQQEVEVRKVIAQPRLELGRRKKASQSETEQVLIEARLRLEEIALARQRELFEKGLATRENLAVAEARLVETRQQLEMAKRNRAFAEEELAIRRQELELQHRTVSDRRAIEVHRELPMLDGTAALQPSDQLTIAIATEPDLPTTFVVRADGSIRFPFLGSIRVQGSTAGQVQAAIQKLLSDKGLAQSPVVTVSARRR